MLALAFAARAVAADPLEPVDVEGQPLAANLTRLVQALELLGAPLPDELRAELSQAAQARDAATLQRLIDPHVLLVVTINPESRVKVARGPAEATLQQHGYRPLLVKVLNQSTVTKPLSITSPQSGPVYAGSHEVGLSRQGQLFLQQNENVTGATDRFLDLEVYSSPPMTGELSGLEVEYAIAVIYSTESGKREATIGFDVGQGSQELGFRGETPILFEVRPAVPVRLDIKESDGRPSTARLTFRDAAGHVYPPQPKRLAPDFFFQEQVYRHDGEYVHLPPGRFEVESSRGPEYRLVVSELVVPDDAEEVAFAPTLERWIDPAAHGYFSGDHHIHGAGCSHYQSPTEGVSPADMFRQVKGEGLNVGCVLTWGPCYEFQRNYFSPLVDRVSEPRTLLKYDVEVSGFGSQSLGHVCLLNLSDQTYPGSDGTKTKGWPTWTTPVMRWTKEQGGVAGYAHSASGLEVNPANAAKRLLTQLAEGGESLDPRQAEKGLLPEGFETLDADRDGAVTEAELVAGIDRAADRLPNLAVPEMNGVGAMEICVSTALGACDFISAMDTPRVAEWNCWYHLLNCGFPIKVSGETDFPCMSSTRVGQGRVYVRLGEVESIDYAEWCRGLAAGRSYVSDGYAHAVAFTVAGAEMVDEEAKRGEGEEGTRRLAVSHSAGDTVELSQPAEVEVRANVAFAPETPKAVAHGRVPPEGGRRFSGDTVHLRGPRPQGLDRGGELTVELIVNGEPVESRQVPADGNQHELTFTVPIERSSWVAVRQFPQLHTNPVTVIVDGRPIRASRESALWCMETIRLLWENRSNSISDAERPEAATAFQKAIGIYRRIAEESLSPDG